MSGDEISIELSDFGSVPTPPRTPRGSVCEECDRHSHHSYRRPRRPKLYMIIMLGFTVTTVFAAIVLVITALILSQIHIKLAYPTGMPIANFSDGTVHPGRTTPVVNSSAGWLEVAKMLSSSIDMTVNPCDDFYQYACGNWEKQHALPTSSDQINDQTFAVKANMQRLITAIDQVNDSHMWPYGVKQVANAYKSCTKASDRSYNGSELIKLLDEFGGWPMAMGRRGHTLPKQYSPEKVIGLLSTMYDVQALFHTQTMVDWKNVKRMILYLDKGGPTYPATFYNKAELNRTFIPALKVLISKTASAIAATMNSSAHSEQIQNDTDDLVDLELTIAKWCSDNPGGTFQDMYTPMNLTYTGEKFNNFYWEHFFEGVSGCKTYNQPSMYYGHFIMMNNNFTTALNKKWNQYRTSHILVNYLLWRLVHSNLQFVPGYKNLYLEFLNKVDGITSLSSERSLECASTLTQYLPWAVGNLFSTSYKDQFPSAQTQVQSVLTSLLGTFREMIAGSPWMDQQTKAAAISKANGLMQNIGFPDWILNGTLLDKCYPPSWIGITDDADWFSTMQQLKKYKGWYDMTWQIGLNADRHDFGYSPAQLNVWSSLWYNSITIPVSVMSPPFFKSDWPMAANYGGLGHIIGMVTTQNFDKIGAEFGANGELSRWMTPWSSRSFDTKCECLEQEYDNFCYNGESALCTNGKSTEMQNFADNSGVLASYLTYKSQSELYGQEPRLPGYMSTFTMNQVFFLTFAQIHCQVSNRAYLRNLLLTGKHAPDKFRVIGTLRNLKVFAEAFHCDSGYYMTPKKPCKLW